MTCQQVASENLVERYLQGTLDGALRDDFESHYFECEACLSELRTVRTVAPMLAARSAPGNPHRRGPRMAMAAAAAAATIVVALLWWPKPDAVSPANAPAPPVAVLALSDIRPAPYAPAVFRDGAAPPDPAFEAAMRLYQDRQWTQAARALEAIPNPPAAAWHFAGVSRLLAGESAAALADLDRVIALGEKSPYEEEARYYRAQALLLAGRLPEARQELEHVIERRGDHEAQARALLHRF